MKVLNTDPFALLSDFERQFERFAGDRSQRRGTGWLPAADVIADEHQIKVVVDAPGVLREDLTIEVDDGFLTITGRRRALEVAGATAQRIERGWGEWTRSMRLRGGLDPDGVSADLTDGVLTVTIPVAETAKPRRIEIGEGGSARRELQDANA